MRKYCICEDIVCLNVFTGLGHQTTRSCPLSLSQINQASLCCIHTCRRQNGHRVSSHLAVAPGEALAAGTGVVKGDVGGQGQARAPVEAGLALTEVQVMAGPGWSWLGWAWDVQGEQEQKDERRGTAANARHRPHPRALCCLSPALGVPPVPSST